MSEKTHIQWSGYIDQQTGQFLQGGTLNIGGGCTKVNDECKFCYAMEVTAGLQRKLGDKYAGLTKSSSLGAQWTNSVKAFPERLEPVLRKRKGQAWFVSSLTDVFHEGFEDEYLDEVFGMFAVAQKHRFYILTKRPERMKHYLSERKEQILIQAAKWVDRVKVPDITVAKSWPLSNVWCGATAGTNKSLNEFLPHLVDTPAVVQWLSMEPLLENVNLKDAVTSLKEDGKDTKSLLWAVIGGESGPYCRKMEPEWALNAIQDCRDLGMSPFFKQKGERLAREMGLSDRKGGDLNECDSRFQIREWPVISSINASL